MTDRQHHTGAETKGSNYRSHSVIRSSISVWKRCWPVSACLTTNCVQAMFGHVPLRTGSDAGMLRFWPMWEKALFIFNAFCMFDEKQSRSDAGMFLHVSLWPNVGKRFMHF